MNHPGNNNFMECECDSDPTPVNIPLTSDPSSSSNSEPPRPVPGELEAEVRRIIHKRRANDSFKDPHTNKKLSVDPSDNPDPRLINRYSVNSKPPFYVHMEKLITPPLALFIWCKARAMNQDQAPPKQVKKPTPKNARNPIWEHTGLLHSVSEFLNL